MSGMEHTVPKRYLEVLGGILVSYGLMEDNARFLLTGFINENQKIGRLLTSELPFRTVRSLFIGLYKEKIGEDDDFKKLKDLLKRAAALEQKRNTIYHSMIAGDLDDESVPLWISKEQTKEKKGFYSVSLHMSYEELKEFYDDIRILDSDFHDFFEQRLASKGIYRDPYPIVEP